MSESERVLRDSRDQKQKSASPSLCLTIILDSLLIISKNMRLFLLHFLLFSLPLSLLTFSLYISSIPAHSRILHLESLALQAHTRFEARHVWKESRRSALSLLHLKLLYFFPTYLLSLLSSISSVVSADAAFNNRRPITLSLAFSALLSMWTRPLLTSACIYVILMLYSALPRLLAAVIGARFTLGIWVLGSCLEVYVAAVLGMGLLVSILDSKKTFGLDAIRVGSGLMQGRRLCGILLSGLLGLATGLIGWRMERVVDGRDLEKVALVGLYGMVMTWGFVVYTVYYCECKKRQIAREMVGGDDDDHGVADASLQVI